MTAEEKGIKGRLSDVMQIPHEYLSEKPPFPKSIKIELTSRCDLECFFCSLTFKERTKADIDPDFLKKLLKELNDCGVEQVGLFWLGEPLLNPKLPEYVRYAKDIGIKYVFITTNGRMATEKKLRPIFDAGLDSIKISVNSIGREQYKKVTGVDAFDRVMENISQLQKIRGDSAKPAIYASTIFDPNSDTDLYEQVKPVIEDAVDEHYGLRLYGEFTYDEVVDGKENVPEKVTARKLQDMLPCWSVFTEPHISYDGFLSICYCDHDRSLYVADLNKMSFREAWHCDEYVAIRRAHLNKDVSGFACENCIAYNNAKDTHQGEVEKGKKVSVPSIV